MRCGGLVDAQVFAASSYLLFVAQFAGVVKSGANERVRKILLFDVVVRIVVSVFVAIAMSKLSGAFIVSILKMWRDGWRFHVFYRVHGCIYCEV